MSERKYTPGPWEVWREPGIESRDLSVGPVRGGIAVADILTTNAHSIATAESISAGHANAALIAASPELLEALELLERKAALVLALPIPGHRIDLQAALATARIAIAKAKGE